MKTFTKLNKLCGSQKIRIYEVADVFKPSKNARRQYVNSSRNSDFMFRVFMLWATLFSRTRIILRETSWGKATYVGDWIVAHVQPPKSEQKMMIINRNVPVGWVVYESPKPSYDGCVVSASVPIYVLE